MYIVNVCMTAATKTDLGGYHVSNMNTNIADRTSQEDCNQEVVALVFETTEGSSQSSLRRLCTQREYKVAHRSAGMAQHGFGTERGDL